MGKFTVSEFAELCGVGVAHVSTYVSRGKIVKDKDNKIDDSLPENAYFLQKSLEKKQKALADEAKALEKGKGKSRFALDEEKKRLEIEKLRVDTRIQELKEQKLKGEIIPSDLVKDIFAQHNQSIITAFKNGTENILTLFAKKASLSPAEIAEIRGELIQIVNKSVDEAVDNSKRQLLNITREFADTRGRGERK